VPAELLTKPDFITEDTHAIGLDSKPIACVSSVIKSGFVSNSAGTLAIQI